MTGLTWIFRFFDPGDETAAVRFLNEGSRQGPGEVSAIFSHGSVGLFYLDPGSLGTSTRQTWQFRTFTADEGLAAAGQFLNEGSRQGPGEASAILYDDGSVGLFYLDPGSLGNRTQPTWLVQNFPNATAAARSLNAAPRRGSGQVSAIVRGDGSVGLIYLDPGSLGTSTRQTWQFRTFNAAQGPEAAVQVLNEAPRQGPGEASASHHAGSTGPWGLFYLAPGTG